MHTHILHTHTHTPCLSLRNAIQDVGPVSLSTADDLDAALPAGMPELYFAGFDNRDEYWTVLREYLFSSSPRYWVVLCCCASQQ